MVSQISIEWAGERLTLFGGKGLLWRRTSTLLIADPHFGKASSFRSVGIPVPSGTTEADLARLNALLDESSASRLIVLGDFFHHRTGQCAETMRLIGEWRSSRQSLEVLIVSGNHDRRSAAPPASWNVTVIDDLLREGPFCFCHDPLSNDEPYAIGGHVHPCITYADSVGPPLRLPCYWFNTRFALLPAFGGFTGTYRVQPESGDRTVAISPDGTLWPITHR